ncbi:zinc-ribbon domain-containing protein [Lactobacillus delbrueckii]|uniref:zinc-ribbon domain-containing protein n=1 Tax=Lactobacillus delbrueckii TaxID=1584 RepID=UPI00288A7E47|nr:zinc-ribbon domain-containing protein [Lactobacillus delbrueckii]
MFLCNTGLESIFCQLSIQSFYQKGGSKNDLIYCANCGAKNQANATFCANCGAKLVKPAQSSQPTQQVQPVKPAKTGKRRADLKQVRKWEKQIVQPLQEYYKANPDQGKQRRR